MKIRDSSFVISTNGYADGPAQALQEYLLAHKAKTLTVVTHPLVSEAGGWHKVCRFESGKKVYEKTHSLPNKPPLTYLFDMFVPFSLPKADAWFGFNNLAAYRGLRRGSSKVVYWAVDFVPGRFGPGSLTKIYNYLDKKACTQADLRVELSQAALDGRTKYLGLDKKSAAPAVVAPMGAWLARTAKATDESWQKRTIVYLGHLVERQGVGTLIKALAVLDKKGIKFKAAIIGSGPLEAKLKKVAAYLKIKNLIFHGFVKDHKDVENILGAASIAAAPYKKDKTSFTQFADPGKLKAYLGAGLPIVLTDVPPNAWELQAAGAAVIAQDSPGSIASAIESLLDKNEWSKAHRSALAYAEQFDWNVILKNTLQSLGFD